MKTGNNKLMTLQISAILPGKDGKKNDCLTGFISISKSIRILENTVKICAIITSIPAIMTVLSCSDLPTGLCISGSPKVSEMIKERAVMPASMWQLLQTIL
jgi:hypothetical protein